MNLGGLDTQPRKLSLFWLRRMSEASFLTCMTILVLYAWARFIPTGYQLPIGMAVHDVAAAVAAVGSVVSLVVCFWPPRNHITAGSIFVYMVIIATCSVSIVTSGSITSPFIAAWIAVALFAALFGSIVLALMAILVLAQIIFSVITGGFDMQITLGYLFFGLLPLLFSVIIWGRSSPQKVADAYSDLEHKLSSAEGKSDVVINTIDDGVLAISNSGIIELINPSAQRMIGWNQGDALGLSWQSVLKLVNAEGKEVSDSANPVAQSLITNKPTHADNLFLLTSSEKRRLVSIVSSPVGANAEGIIVVFRDITREKAEEREQAEFISTASHEMRTPVASIEGYLGLALNPATAQIDEKARDFITKAHASAQHLGRLFQDLLDISRAEDGRLKNEPKVINMNEFIAEIFEGLRPKANEKNLTYVYKPTLTDAASPSLSPLFYTYVDPDHLREIVSNLIENAIKYTPAGEVTVDITGDDAHVIVSVKDSGIGIPAEDIPHLFQKFYRVDNSDTREIGGTGLGLYLSRRLAETMSGSLQVESEYKKGSTFFLNIPRMSSSDASIKAQQEAQTQDSATQNVVSDLTYQMQDLAMPQELADLQAAPAPEPVQTAADAPAPIPMQAMAPTPPTQIPTAPPAYTAPPTAVATPEPAAAVPMPAPAAIPAPEPVPPPQPPAPAPAVTLSDIERNLQQQRGQVSVPER